jgi:hypothetical protein
VVLWLCCVFTTLRHLHSKGPATGAARCDAATTISHHCTLRHRRTHYSRHTLANTSPTTIRCDCLAPRNACRAAARRYGGIRSRGHSGSRIVGSGERRIPVRAMQPVLDPPRAARRRRLLLLGLLLLIVTMVLMMCLAPDVSGGQVRAGQASARCAQG